MVLQLPRIQEGRTTESTSPTSRLELILDSAYTKETSEEEGGHSTGTGTWTGTGTGTGTEKMWSLATAADSLHSREPSKPATDVRNLDPEPTGRNGSHPLYGSLISGYVVVKLVGQGAFGLIYLVRELISMEHYIMKVRHEHARNG